ncbi:MAG: hypothetical protein U0Q16_06690 [Bryobacteraceae bacterium]
MLIAILAATLNAATDWMPVDPAQLALKAPAIDADADAEVLYWEVRIADKFQSPDVWTSWRHYLRIKVFTERGAKDQATLELGFYRKTLRRYLE